MANSEANQNMPFLSTIRAGHEIDAAERIGAGKRIPYNQSHFDSIGITAVWEKYEGILNWGEGQSLAIVDDGCDLTVPEWQNGKVRAAWNAFEQNDDPTPVPPGYHGTSVGYPSSLCYNGLCGVAYKNQTVQIRSCTIVHLPRIEGEDVTIARALNWIADHAEEYGITAVNLSALDDKPHTAPCPTVVDEPLCRLREMNIWVSAPCGNNQHTNGISWPACQEYCYAIGSVEEEAVYNDRYANTDLLVHAQYTSSSNAYAAGSYQIWREAVIKAGFPWRDYGKTLPEAAMAVFQKTGCTYHDEATGLSFQSLNLLAAVDFVMPEKWSRK
jgi:hypothetical protein